MGADQTEPPVTVFTICPPMPSMKSPVPTYSSSKLLGLASMAPMARLGSASPMGTQVGVVAPKLYDRHIPPPDMETITCAGSAGFTRMPLIRPESMALYGTAFHSKAAVLGPTL